MTKRMTFTATHERILAAIVELAATKPLRALTVTEVTQKLALNRGTFYLHFVDLPAAITALETELIAALTVVVQPLPANWLATFSPAQEQAVYRALTTAIKAKFTAYQVLLGENGDQQFILKLRQQLKRYIAPTLATGNTGLPDVPSSFLRELIIGGLFDILVFWVLHEPELSVAQVAAIIYQSRHRSPAQLVLQSLK
ncbi:TetR/AcrR family transcriptional regulator [Loigolactobacillus binensis]|uniref:TetR/AcrR family transcriptional regulator n=1 Tax=Loigolactobacillus binensis TaxID=2559922 RepID=A0ABW3ED07_9LACO|nr:TetR/AcrR family transcriptional regulator [Loigolactobacillus binensis]